MVRLTEQDKQALSIVQGDVMTQEQVIAVLHTFSRQMAHVPHTALVYKGDSLEECAYNMYIDAKDRHVILSHGWGYSTDTIPAVVDTFLHSDVWSKFDVYLSTDFDDYDFALYFYSTDLPGIRENAIKGSFKFRYNKDAK
jgi:hypothetical protein